MQLAALFNCAIAAVELFFVLLSCSLEPSAVTCSSWRS
jgi:hypothetical protein